MKLIELNLQRIIDLCRKHKVKTLAVFGSILTDRFNDQSDVDLLVDFDTTDHEKWDYVSNYFDFRDALERLFGRKVDLVVGKGLRNKYFIANVNRTKQMIYGWKEVINTRNRIIHGYDSVETEFLWGLVVRHIPQLKRDIEQIIAEYEEQYNRENGIHPDKLREAWPSQKLTDPL